MHILSTELSSWKRGVRRFLVLGAVALCLALSGGMANAAKDKGHLERAVPVSTVQKTQAPLYVTVGKAELIDLEGPVADILVANPGLIDVQAVQAKRLYVVGLQVGDTNLMALDTQGNIVKRIDVHVKYDLQAIQSLVEQLFPNEYVKVGSIHDQILLTGEVSTPEQASKIVNLIGHYVSDLQDADDPADELIANLLEVRGEQQVMLRVKIVEATRSILKELGMETHTNNPTPGTTSIFADESVESTFGGGTGIDGFRLKTGDGITLSKDATTLSRLVLDTGVNGIGNIGLFLNALEEQNLVNILAEPNLTAVSGEQAGFLAGGEFPVPTGRDQYGNIVIEFREFGVSLNFRPVVLSDERINLQMNTEVSSLDFENAVVLADVNVPGLDIRRAETTVEIPSGGSLMIAGLLKSDAIKDMSGLPGVSDTPVLGDLISSDSFQRDETELVVIVTPYLVEPYAEKQRTKDKTKPYRDNPLARLLAENLERLFGFVDYTLLGRDERYGYLLH